MAVVMSPVVVAAKTVFRIQERAFEQGVGGEGEGGTVLVQVKSQANSNVRLLNRSVQAQKGFPMAVI